MLVLALQLASVALLWCCQWHGGTCWAASTAHASASDRTKRSGDAARTSSSGSCQNGEVSECVSKLDLLSQNQSLAFATTEAELKRICSHLTGALDCVNAFTRRCFNEKQQEVYKRLTSGAAQLIEDFCREGSPFRLTYLKHSKCYKELQDDYNNQMDGYKQCAKAVVLLHCDVEAAELAEDIIVKAGGYLVTTHCSGYRIDEPSCRGCSVRAAIALPAIVAVLTWLQLLPRTL
ncbi:hypothetical protein MTO96_047687 [Rhipicephalus appendiculatus]